MREPKAGDVVYYLAMGMMDLIFPKMGFLVWPDGSPERHSWEVHTAGYMAVEVTVDHWDGNESSTEPCWLFPNEYALWRKIHEERERQMRQARKEESS